MSSTGCSIGYDVDRTTSRVLKPPGGGSSDIFGGAAEPVIRKKTDYQKSNIFSNEAPPTDHSCRGTNARSKEKWTSHVFAGSDEKGEPIKSVETTNTAGIDEGVAESPKENQVPKADAPKKSASVSQKRVDANQNIVDKGAGRKPSDADLVEKYKDRMRGVYNPITGDAYNNKGAEQQRVTTKITAPPGGRSSGPLW